MTKAGSAGVVVMTGQGDKEQTFNAQRSTLNAQHSTFKLRTKNHPKRSFQQQPSPYSLLITHYAYRASKHQIILLILRAFPDCDGKILWNKGNFSPSPPAIFWTKHVFFTVFQRPKKT
jgi:hypothetical protein